AVQQGTLHLHVQDWYGKPVSGVVVAPEGTGNPSQETSDTGYTFLTFTYEDKRPFTIPLTVKTPRDWFIYAPVEGNSPVPPCDTGSACLVKIAVAKRGQRLTAAAIR